MKSAAKQRLKDFLEKTAIGQTYEFDFPGNALQAEQHVQNMRVQLSRVKKRYKVAKKNFNEFKVTIEAITPKQIEAGDGRSIDGVHVIICRKPPNNLDSLLADVVLG